VCVVAEKIKNPARVDNFLIEIDAPVALSETHQRVCPGFGAPLLDSHHVDPSSEDRFPGSQSGSDGEVRGATIRPEVPAVQHPSVTNSDRQRFLTQRTCPVAIWSLTFLLPRLELSPQGNFASF
jgi:hypothetical protein